MPDTLTGASSATGLISFSPPPRNGELIESRTADYDVSAAGQLPVQQPLGSGRMAARGHDQNAAQPALADVRGNRRDFSLSTINSIVQDCYR